jgi:hypothetical protein
MEKQFYELLKTLSPYLGQVVICGGWAIYVYRKFLDPDGAMPMGTSDLDLATKDKLKRVKDPIDKLLTDQGYVAKQFPEHEPPAMKFEKKGEPDVEFLAPQRGQGKDETVEIEKNVVAIRRRYLDVMIENVIQVDVSKAAKLPEKSMSIRVPTPAAYLFHKGLSFTQRTDREKKAKDLAYMFELMNNFPRVGKTLLAELVALKHPAGWFRTFVKNLAPLFDGPEGTGVTMVASQEPPPYDELARQDPMLFKRVVHDRFNRLIEAVKEL